MAANTYRGAQTAGLKTPPRFAKVHRNEPQLASKRSDPWLSGLKVKVFLKRQHEAVVMDTCGQADGHMDGQ